MRVGFFLPDLRGGGAERAAMLFARYWPSRDPQPVIVLRSAGGRYLHEASDLTVVDLGLDAVGWSATVRTPWRLAKVARARQLDVMVTFLTVPSAVAMRLWARNVQVVWDVQNPQWRGDRGAATWNSPARSVATRLAVRGLGAMILPSRGLETDAGLGRFPGRVMHIPNPVDPAWLVPEHRPVEWQPRCPPFHLVAVGRLVRQKRFDLLLEALHLLRQDAAIRLTIYGEGQEKGALESLREKLNLQACVTFAGFESDIRRIYEGADAFVLCSDFEGFGNVIVEALAFGLPVVATDAPFGPRDILDGGRFGVLVPPGSPGALADGIRSALPGGDQHDRLRELAVDRARQYSAPVVAGRLCDALQEAQRREWRRA